MKNKIKIWWWNFQANRCLRKCNIDKFNEYIDKLRKERKERLLKRLNETLE